VFGFLISMAKKKTNLSKHDASKIPSAKGMKVAIVVSEWNPEITEALYNGAVKTLKENDCKAKNISRVNVPGSFELPSAAQFVAERKKVDVIICIGCVIQGETRHFDFICEAVANGIVNVSLKYNLPVIFGVLTTNNMAQAKARAGGKHGNKGVEAAVSAIKMAKISRQ
jgi:6,7-dimethyl-8-ribityllumazine synthase